MEENYTYIQALEEANLDYLNLINNPSEESKLGHKLLLLKKNFPFGLYKLYMNHKKWTHIDKEVAKLSKAKNELPFYNPGKCVSKAHGVAYTCITGKYDKLREPILRTNSMDYVVYTDNRDFKPEKWDARIIKKINGISDNYTNRYYKLHPKELFGDHDFSVYIDGNVQIVSDISTLYSIAKESKVGIAMHKHSERDCIFDEGEACLLHGRGNSSQIKKQLEKYKSQGMPAHFGLLEATIIVVDLNNEIAIKLMNDWWEEFDYWQSGRDQLAFTYILWKNGYTINDVGILGNNKFMNPKFRVGDHAEWRK